MPRGILEGELREAAPHLHAARLPAGARALKGNKNTNTHTHTHTYTHCGF